MVKRYFITGTDTDCGKTYVTCQLLKHFSKAHAIKPVASGIDETTLTNADLLALKKHTAYPELAMNQWLFKAPVAPHIAAAMEQQTITAKAIDDFCKQPQFESLDTLLIEGAGGLMVPLNEQETWLDFLKLSEIPVIVVVGLKLGCINHALLTAAVLKAEGIHCHGWIANDSTECMPVREENRQYLIRQLNLPFLGTIEYNGSFR